MESKTKNKTAKISKSKEKKIKNNIIVEEDEIVDTDILKFDKTSTNIDLEVSEKSVLDDKIILTPEQNKVYEDIVNFIKNIPFKIFGSFMSIINNTHNCGANLTMN